MCSCETLCGDLVFGTYSSWCMGHSMEIRCPWDTFCEYMVYGTHSVGTWCMYMGPILRTRCIGHILWGHGVWDTFCEYMVYRTHSVGTWCVAKGHNYSVDIVCMGHIM